MNTSALSDWMIERLFKSLVPLRNSSERERIINYLAFFVSTLLNYGCCRVLDAIFETKDAIEKGADEIDYVINVAELKNKNYDYIKKEMEEIVKICREAGKTSKVIFENCYLTDDEKRKVAEIAKEVKPDFIKTSTGFGTGGATVEDVKLMKSVVGDEVKVKAAGGIRDLKTALAMIEAGAERLGTSAGVAIVEEYNNQK